MSINPKIVIALIIAGVITALIFGLKYYKDSYEESLINIGKMQDEVDNLKTASQACSDGTEKLEEEAKKKAAAAAAARAQANTLAAANESLAQQLLAATANSGDVCLEANKLATEYLAKKKKVVK